jgi:hypothetical protein
MRRAAVMRRSMLILVLCSGLVLSAKAGTQTTESFTAALDEVLAR